MKKLFGIIITLAALAVSATAFAEGALQNNTEDSVLIEEIVSDTGEETMEEPVTSETVIFRFNVKQDGTVPRDNARFYLFDTNGVMLQAKSCSISSDTQTAELTFEVEQYELGKAFYFVPAYGMISVSRDGVVYEHHTPIKLATSADEGGNVFEFDLVPEPAPAPIPEPAPAPEPVTPSVPKQAPSVERVHDPETEYQEKLAAIMNASGIDSKTDYLIWVSKQDYSVRVFLGSKGNWKYVTRFACSIGAPSSPTITGKFEYYAYQDRWQYANYYCGPIMRFAANGYAMHSTLIRYDGTPYDARLGMQISHGCVRLAPASIRWLVDYIPLHTRVYVTP